MIKVTGYASHRSLTSLKPMESEREEAKPNEVVIDILFTTAATIQKTFLANVGHRIDRGHRNRLNS